MENYGIRAQKSAEVEVEVEVEIEVGVLYEMSK